MTAAQHAAWQRLRKGQQDIIQHATGSNNWGHVKGQDTGWNCRNTDLLT